MADAVDFSFPVDQPMKSQLSDKSMCRPESTPGLVRVLNDSKSSPMPETGYFINDVLKAGLTIAGPALGLPGIASMHFAQGQAGIEFSALDTNQTPIKLEGKLTGGGYTRLTLELHGDRKIEIDCQNLYPKNPPKDQFGVKTEAFGLPIASSRGVEVKSYLTDTKQGTIDCLSTNFNEQGQPVQAGYTRKMSDYRTLELKFNQAEGTEIFLTQGGTRDGSKAEQNLTITQSGIKNEQIYHSAYDAYPY